ncbi:hypothetical protein D3C78_20490 [compost metagenome]
MFITNVKELCRYIAQVQNCSTDKFIASQIRGNSRKEYLPRPSDRIEGNQYKIFINQKTVVLTFSEGHWSETENGTEYVKRVIHKAFEMPYHIEYF